MPKNEIKNDHLLNVSGGKRGSVSQCGGAIYANCSRCGKRFQAGNAGANHLLYPLQTVCPECSSK